MSFRNRGEAALLGDSVRTYVLSPWFVAHLCPEQMCQEELFLEVSLACLGKDVGTVFGLVSEIFVHLDTVCL